MLTRSRAVSFAALGVLVAGAIVGGLALVTGDDASAAANTIVAATPRISSSPTASATPVPGRSSKPALKPAPRKPRKPAPAPSELLRAPVTMPAPPAQPQQSNPGEAQPGAGNAGSGNPSTAPQPPSGATTGDSGIAQAVFNAVNSARAQAGLPALNWNPALQRSAHQHNLAMAAANTMSHQLSGEPGLGARESAQGVQWSFAAENIGWTTDRSTGGALNIEASMLAEKPPNDGHRQNILSATANSLGVDIVLDSAHGKLWLTEDFAAS